MTIEAYRQKVEDLETRMKSLHRMAVTIQADGYWDAYYLTKSRWQAARAYLRKREKQEAMA